MTFNAETARDYLNNLDLPAPLVVPQGDEVEDENPFNTVKDQATLVGQDVLAFMTGTEEVFRKAISDSSLLAQMVADRRVTDKGDIYGWYEAYFEVLRNIGWVVQDQGWAEYREAGDGFEVHEKILEVATVVLGAAPAALAIVTTTLNALKGMKADSPFITLFNRSSTHAEAARFQINVVQPHAESRNLLIAMMAFGLQAEKTITQVLFFKATKNRSTLRSNSGKISVNVDALADLGPLINQKVRGYQHDYIMNLPDLS